MPWKSIVYWGYSDSVANYTNTQNILNKFTEYFARAGRFIRANPYTQSKIRLLSSTLSDAIKLTIRSTTHFVSSVDTTGIVFPNNATQSPMQNHLYLSGELDKTIGLFEQSWFSRGSGVSANNVSFGFKRGALFCDFEVATIEDQINALRASTWIWQDKD